MIFCRHFNTALLKFECFPVNEAYPGLRLWACLRSGSDLGSPSLRWPGLDRIRASRLVRLGNRTSLSMDVHYHKFDKKKDANREQHS